VQQGLHGLPTCINNVETLATVPVIIARGGRWFSRIGIQGNTGTKIFSLVGSVKNVGLIEVPLGTRMKDIVEQIGGGVPEGRTLKAVQTGGPSGGCIPARRMDIPLSYESLVYVIVRDTGIGIAPEDLPHVFERFYRGKQRLPGEVGGSGLGLALVKVVVESHGGEVYLDSTPGQGTTVTVVLPAGMRAATSHPMEMQRSSG
jgi:hypothetical protein